MYQPSSGQRAATIESEVFYWRLLGFQVAVVYGFVLVALLTGVLSIFDEAFDATVLTVTAIFSSSLLYMPQSKQPCFDACKQRKVKHSNAKYRFSRQWSIRRQDSRRRACSQQPSVTFIRTGCRALVAFFSAIAKLESWTYGDVQADLWRHYSFRGRPALCQRFLMRVRRGPRFHLQNCMLFGSIRSPVLQCGTMGDVALRGSYVLAGDAAVRWYIVLFHRVPGISRFLAQLTLYCFFGAVMDTLQIAGRCSFVAWRTLGTVAQARHETRIFSHSSVRWRGSGFRNIYLTIFILFLLGGFLLEGNPPRPGTGLQAAPMHAGGADPPVQRWSQRLARGNSIGSTLRRSIEPEGNRTYVQRWPTASEVSVRESASVGDVPEFSIADPNSPPSSPQADVVEAEVLDGSFVLNVMRSLDAPSALQFERRAHEDSHRQIEPTQDIETTQAYLEFPAPTSDRCSEPASDVIEIDSGVDSKSQTSPGPRRGRPRKSSAKAKAKSGAKFTWVPKIAAAPSEAQSKAEAWATLDSIDLAEEWKHACATVREVPEFFSSPGAGSISRGDVSDSDHAWQGQRKGA